MGHQLSKMYWLIDHRSELTLNNKVLYKSILKPIWTYGNQLWSTAANSNVEILQRFQSETLHLIINTPWYVTNDQLRKDLCMPTKEEIRNLTIKYKDRIKEHPNTYASGLMEEYTSARRIKRKIPQDLIK